ncbi:kelch domain-containing protein 2-like isoform X2 [Amphibalanus amphitrite]|nr:kelch domain-containing protein 2-like isoform X2 [Amphibalanus amphitrite]XP_043228858.1 kelch domain-containing protein 2-like isoform X2 [Amphibalanus amphitrite]XP_043228859.1 kelch domain-containing protein 2-like isoform X2 [Amphibalanus amphitrite]XP_043228860.1 kelch domain-containing protein 2-like isoform X2 [Amphibalanus amphitrite]XP_043228861.1 kelch domain-containing protein 2-like isoform X2 [Amphibalanus amphitrite]XP_043228862.1 kelch domain-containing protein 2-like isofor
MEHDEERQRWMFAEHDERCENGENCVEPMNAKSPKLHRRVGHVAVKYKNFVVVWGGYEDDEQYDNNAYTREPYYHPADEVMLYDCEYEVWHGVRIHGDPPPRLCGATAGVIGDRMLLFGGFMEDRQLGTSNVRTVYELDLNKMAWKQIWADGVPPLACDKLVSWCYEGKFYLFGGFGPWPDDPGYYRDVRLAAHPGAMREDRCWNDQLVRLADGRWEWPETRGDRPTPRAAHAAALVGSRAYIFGGRLGNRLNDFYCLDLETMVWTKLEPSDPAAPVPAARSWHSLTALDDHGRLLLYGGFDALSQPLADPWIWSPSGQRWSPCTWLSEPPIRMWHAATPGEAGEVVLFGGLASSVLLDQPTYASGSVFLRETPKSLIRLCLDVLDANRETSVPLVWFTPSPLADGIIARLTACGSKPVV